MSLEFPCSAFLIGSYARGDFNLWSDVDILLMADFQGNLIERQREIDFPPGFEILPFTISEIVSIKDKKRKFYSEVLHNHVILRDDLNAKSMFEDEK